MDCLIQKCIIFNFLMSIASVTGGIRSPCPLACDCDLEKGMVDCKYGAWSKLPNIPAGTKHIRMTGGHFEKTGKFSGPSSCQNYSEVKQLELYVNFSSLADGIFRCMPKLHSLTSKYSSLKSVSNGTFLNVPKLVNVTFLWNNNLEEGVLPRLCDIRKLEIVNMRLRRKIWNVKPPIPACLGSLEHLSDFRLEYFSMDSERITQTLQPLQNVSNSISLQSCGIDRLQNDTFFMFKARILDLTGNYISWIRNHTFTRMPYLIELNLNGNDIWGYGYKPLMVLSSLQVLSLYGISIFEVPHLPNNIRKFKFEHSHTRKLKQGSFSNLKNLEELDLSMPGIALGGIDQIERSAFHNLQKLEILKLTENSIEGSSLSNLLLDVGNCPLKILDLSGNPIRTLNKTFQTLDNTTLERLYLSRCKIEEITQGEFGTLKHLKVLDLSYNEMRYLHMETFQGFTNLTTVVLHHNFLQSVAMNGLSLNIPLEHLDVSNNHIRTAYFINVLTLMEIDLSHNEMGTTFQTFKNLTSLRHLNLSSNQMTSYPYDYYGDFNLPNLSELDLSDNPMISPRFSQGFQGLESLKLSRTLIGHYTSYYEPVHSTNPKDVWVNKTNLKSLYVNNCQIKTLTPGMFNSSSQLRILDVSSNGIASVHHSAFQGVPMLTELYLHDNDITYVNWESFVDLPHLRHLSLANNPILCTCDVLWLFKAVTAPEWVFIHNQDQLVCQGPESDENIKIKDLDMKVSDCENHWVLKLGPIAGSIGSILVFVLLYIAWYYRWHIRYTLFLARAGLGRYKEYINDYPYKYDAFVAYSGEDLAWVKNQLLRNVDMDYIGRGGFTLCLHHRDWLAGVDIVENIMKSLTESRRTILVLSKNFAKSQWCQYELAMAHLKASAEGYRQDRIVVILLNDIPPELLTPRLVYMLTTKTYLPWPQDPNLQELFWRTLRKSLKKELLYQTNV